MKHFFVYLLSGLILVSCSAESEGEVLTDKSGEKEQESQIEIQATDFSDDSFGDDKSLKILEELDICVLKDSLGLIAECSPQNFKIIPFKKNASMEDAFILEVKAGVLLKGSTEPLPPIRHIIVFERENGKLVQVNGFRGDLIAVDREGEFADLILALYVKADETLFQCKYEWNGDKYEFKSIEGLDYGDGVVTLKESMRDSVTNEIYGSIMQSNLIF